MAYVPDPTDASMPIGSTKAGTADEEFRALKAYLQGLVLGAVSQGPVTRQTALSGSVDVNGDPNFLSAGVGLSLNLSALNAPLNLTYANGSGAAGDLNLSEAVGADAIGVVAGLAPSNRNYITKLFNGAWGSTLAPCQYGRVFDRQAQLLFRWPGANNAVASTEDFGNAMVFSGNAKLSTAVQILGLNTLALDGTGDFVNLAFSGVGSGSWELFGSFRTASLAVAQVLFAATNAAGFGVSIVVATTGKLQLTASSDGATANIANAVNGATTVAINTTYYYRVVFDQVAGTYRVYLSNNGAAEVQDISVASPALLSAMSVLTIGANSIGTFGFNGNIGFTGFRRYASFTSAQAAGPVAAPTFADVATDFFNIQQMKMYQITAESTVAGTNPTMAAITKLHLGEAVTGGAAVASVVNYAFRGEVDSAFVTPLPAALGVGSKAHNIGVVPQSYDLILENITTEAGYAPGSRVNGASLYTADGTGRVTLGLAVSKYNILFICGSTAPLALESLTTGIGGNLTAANWKYKFVAKRGW